MIRKSFIFTNINNIIIIPSIPDGDCYFHSILGAYSKIYLDFKTSKERQFFCRHFRSLLAEELDKTDEHGKSIYSKLSGGNLYELSLEMKNLSLECLKQELNSNSPVNELYQELISNVFNIDIYLIDLTTGDIYSIGSPLELLYKNRNSIVLGYTRPKILDGIGHYETIGLFNNNKIETVFRYNDEFIISIKKRMLELIK